MWHIIKLKLATENVWLRIFDSLLSVHLDVPHVYRIYHADLRHQYEISFAEAQMFLLAKCP